MKRLHQYLVLSLVMLLLASPGFSQVAKQVTMNLRTLMAQQRAETGPLKGVIADGKDGEELERVHQGLDNPPSTSGRNIMSQQAPAANTNLRIQSPAPTVNFDALSDDMDRQSTFHIPPDTHGAIGRNEIVTATNGEVKIQNKTTGALMGSIVTLKNFWQPLATTMGITLSVFDPRLIYDPFADRYIFAAVANGGSGNSAVLIGVTQSSDPTGSWNLYGFDADMFDFVWADYPALGFNKNWIVITNNMFTVSGGSFSRTDAYVFNKASLYSGSSVSLGTNAQLISDNVVGSNLAPATDYDNTSNTFYLVQTYSSAGGQIRYYTLSGSVPSISGISLLTSATAATPWTSNGNAASNYNFADQQFASYKINNNDARMQNAVIMNNKLWSTHTIFLPSGTPTRSAIQWWKFDIAGNTASNGTIDGGAGTYKAFPSIAVNQAEDVLIGYSVFSSGQYASSAYSFKTAADANFQSEFIYMSGLDTYYKTFSTTTGRNRFGDYSQAIVDPADQTLWTMQEYAETRSGIYIDPVFGENYKRWGTRWAQVPRSTVLNALPVTLEYFKANLVNGQVQLSWKAYAELNLKEYVIERSADGVSFTEFARVSPKGSSGTYVYNSVDDKPYYGISYYRLKPVDFDGRFFVSDRQTIRNTVQQIKFIRLSPNPASTGTSVDIYSPTSSKLNVQLYDMKGRMVYNKPMNIPEGYIRLYVPMQNLSTGNYRLKLSGNNQQFTENVLKQ